MPVMVTPVTYVGAVDEVVANEDWSFGGDVLLTASTPIKLPQFDINDDPIDFIDAGTSRLCEKLLHLDINESPILLRLFGKAIG